MKGLKIKLNAGGIEGSGKLTGITYFGQCTEDCTQYNDFNFPSDEQGFGKRHMLIRFNTEQKQYFIRDLGDGTGTFIKITHPLKIINGFIVSFGDTHMTICVDKDKKMVTIKFLEGMLANEKK